MTAKPLHDAPVPVRHLGTAIEFLADHEIPLDECCLVGSAVLTRHGLRLNGDLDVCVRGWVYRKLRSMAAREGWRVQPDDVIRVGEIDFIPDEYGKLGITTDALLDVHHTRIEGIKVARMELEFAKRAWSRRAKERADMPALEAYAAGDPNWDWSLVTRPTHLEILMTEDARPTPGLPSRIGARLRRARGQPLRRILRSAGSRARRVPGIVERRARRALRIGSTRSLWPTAKPARGATIGMLLWPAMAPWFEQITNEIARDHGILRALDLDYDAAKFSEMVRRVYADEHVPRWHIERKLHFLRDHPKRIRFLEVWLDDAEWTRDLTRDQFVSAHSMRLKRHYRRAYAPRIDDYLYDVVVHATDTVEDCRTLREIVIAFGRDTAEAPIMQRAGEA